MTRSYKTTPKQRVASARWYAKNRRRHIESVQARQRARIAVGSSFSAPPVTVEQIRQRAADLFGTVAT